MNSNRIYFVANARMPSEKAHGIHIAKVCEALVEIGYNVELLVPSRASGASLKEFYGLRVEVPVVRLPSLVFARYERAGYALMSGSFMLAYSIFLLWKRLVGEHFVVYTVDIDTFSHTLLPMFGKTVGEIHAPKPSTVLGRFFFRNAHIVATNLLIAAEIQKMFGVEPLVEPNGVDESFFGQSGSGGGALYVGRFYKWKGLEVLSATQEYLLRRDEHDPNSSADTLAPQVHVLGGTRQEFEKIFGPAGDLKFAEAKPYEVPGWIAKADVLLLVGTAKNQDSNRYTAPMKVFEYLASGKPIVASETEALKSLIPAELVYYSTPDDPQALAKAIERALQDPGDVQARIAFARKHTWREREKRINGQFPKR